MKHCRQLTFATLVVSALVGVGILSEGSERLNRAANQAEIMAGLIEYFEVAAASSEQPLHLTSAMLGPVSTSSERYYEVELRSAEPVVYPEDDVPDSIVCRARFNFAEYLYVSPALGPQYLNLSDTVSGSLTILSGLFGAGGFVWEPSPVVPTGIGEFQVFWDVFVETEEAALISDVMVEFSFMEVWGAGPEPKIFVVESFREIDVFDSETPAETGLLLANDFYPVSVGQSEYFAPDFGFSLHPEVEQLWAEREIEAFTQTNCFVPGESEFVGVLRAPATYSFRSVDWIGSWVAEAQRLGFLSDDVVVFREPFSEAFSDVASEASGLNSASFIDLRNWLLERVDAESQAVEVFGVQFPSALLRVTGVLLILITQLYAFIHVRELSLRLARSRQGDPGAFQPWVALYDANPAIRVSQAMQIAPAVASGIACAVLLQSQTDVSWPTLLAFLGLTTSIFVTGLSLRALRSLREAAKTHR